MSDMSHYARPRSADRFAALPDICFVYGCTLGPIDRRGPVMLRDPVGGNEVWQKACTRHWDGVYSPEAKATPGLEPRPWYKKLTRADRWIR